MKKGRIKLGAVGRFFNRVTALLYYVISASFIGKLFTAYAASDRAVRGSYVGNIGRAKPLSPGRKRYAVRRAVACAMERNVLSRANSKVIRLLCRCNLRTFGLFFVSFALYSSLAYMLSILVWHNDAATWVHLIVGLAVLPVGILLLFSDQSLGCALRRGFFFSVILSGIFGISDDLLREASERGRQGYILALALGCLTGALGMLIHPLFLLCTVLCLLVIWMVLSVPETGALLLLLAIPFVGYLPHGTLLLLALTLLLLVGYVGKLLRGNRVFRMESQDLPVLLIALLLLFSAVSVAGGDAPVRALLGVCLVLAYFPVMNILATDLWLLRCRGAFLTSAAVASGFGIFQFVHTAVSFGGFDAFSAAYYGSFVTVGFADHTTFAYFLVLAFAFAFPSVWMGKKRFRPLWAMLCTLLAGATVLTWVQSAWIALAVIATAVILVIEKRSFPIFFFGAGALTGTYFLLPDGAKAGVNTFLREATGKALHRSSVSEAINRIFQSAEGGLESALQFAFGLGNGGLEALYPLFGDAGTQFTEGTCNFWVRFICECGVAGATAVALLFFFILQNAFSALRDARHREKPVFAYIGIGVIAASLWLSFFRSAWYDPAALSTFFVCAAMVGAGLRLDRRNHFDASDVSIEANLGAELEYRPKHA